MVEKKKSKKNGEALGISGFTLGIAGYFSLLFMGVLSIIGVLAFFITGLVFCIIQQKRKPTKLGKIGLIINIVGIIATIILGIVVAIYLYPLLQEQLQNLPA